MRKLVQKEVSGIIKKTSQTEIKARFEAALNSFVGKIKNDPKILAVILMGSLANDVVWEKSDMDTLVLVRDPKLAAQSYCLEEDGLIINVGMQTEFDFKRSLERSLGGGMTNSMFLRAKVIYSKDDGLNDFISEMQKTGKDDAALTFLQDASSLIYFMEKIEKWLTVKDDPLYAQMWVVYSASTYANMRLLLDDKPVSREAVLKVMEYAPELIEHIYAKPLQGQMTSEDVWNILNFYKKFLEENLELLKQPVESHMSDGQVRTVTNLSKHFRMDSHHIYHIFDFLDEMGVVARVTETVRLTPKSPRSAEEVAFMYIGDKI